MFDLAVVDAFEQNDRNSQRHPGSPMEIANESRLDHLMPETMFDNGTGDKWLLLS